MANLIQRRKIMDGPSHVTLHCYLASDGVSGELKNVILLDPTDDISPVLPRKQSFILKKIWYEMQGFTLTFSFNSLVPWPFWTLTPGASLHHDWRFFGGIADNSSMPEFTDMDTPGNPTGVMQTSTVDPLTGGINSDGKLLISTNGFTDVGDTASFVLWLEKRDRPNPQPV